VGDGPGQVGGLPAGALGRNVMGNTSAAGLATGCFQLGPNGQANPDDLFPLWVPAGCTLWVEGFVNATVDFSVAIQFTANNPVRFF